MTVVLRAAGAALCCGAGIWAGMALEGSLRARAGALRQVRDALRTVQSRAVNLAEPIPEAFRRAGGCFAEAAEHLSDGMEEALRGAMEKTALTKADIDAMASLCAGMACMLREECAGLCAAALAQAEQLEAEASAALAGKGKMYRTLGACAGLAAAVLLL